MHITNFFCKKQTENLCNCPTESIFYINSLKILFLVSFKNCVFVS